MKRSRVRFGIMGTVTVMALVVAAGVTMAECGKVTIGEMDWNSARVIANVEKFILEVGYGCEVEILKTTTVPCLTSMVEKGQPDIASEFWVNSIKEGFEKGGRRGPPGGRRRRAVGQRGRVVSARLFRRGAP